MPHFQCRDAPTDHGGVGVEQGRDTESQGDETPVVGECASQVAETGDGHGPVLGETKFTRNLVDEVLDLVAHPSCSVRAQVGKVLAQFCRIDPGRCGQSLGGDGEDVFVLQGLKGTKVDRESGDGGLRDSPLPGPRRAADHSVCSWAGSVRAGCGLYTACDGGRRRRIPERSWPLDYVLVKACTWWGACDPGPRSS